MNIEKIPLNLFEVKITLSRNEARKIWSNAVHDMGYTQVEPESYTCQVVEPLDSKLCDELFGELKLL